MIRLRTPASLAILLAALFPVLSSPDRPAHAQRAARPATAAPADPDALHFERTLLDTGGPSPELCLRFSAALDSDAAARYADHVSVTPALHPAIRVQDHDLCLGGLAWGVRYGVTVSPGIADAGHHRLPTAVSVSVSTGDRTPELALSGSGFILPRRTAAGLDVQTVNTPQVRLVLWRLSRAAALSATGSNATPNVDLSATRLDTDSFNALRDNQLVRVWSGTMDTPGPRNDTVTTAFPVATLIDGQKPGLYLVTAEDASTPPTRTLLGPKPAEGSDTGANASSIAAHWVDISDLGLSLLRGADGLHVFARSLATALPIPGVAVSLAATGGDQLEQSTTGADGQVAFAAGLLRGTGAETPDTIAADGPHGDFNTVKLSAPWFDLSDRGTEGQPAPGPQQAVIVSDRGIYRPGETVELTTLLRNHAGAAVSDQPLILVLRRPDGIEERRRTLPARAGGGFVDAEALTLSAPLGTWTASAYADPTGSPIGTASFAVQDFVPQTLAVTVTPAAPMLTPGQPLALNIDGRYLYGAPAAGLHGDGTLKIVADPEPVPSLAGYSFGLSTQRVPGDEQKLDVPDADDHGHATVSLSPDIPEGTTLPLKAVVTAALQDPAGRSVGQTVELKLAHARPLLGLLVSDAAGNAGADGGRQTVPVQIAALDPRDHPAALSNLAWSVVRENEVFDWIHDEHGWSFREHVIDEPVQHGTVSTGADGRARIAPSLDTARYRVIVSDPATGAASSRDFFVGWWSAGDGNPTAPDRLVVTTRDKQIAPGGRTAVHVDAPFPGPAQIVIATDRVESVQNVQIPAGGLDVPVTADPSWPGGAYVLATLYRPLDIPARPHTPTRAVGLAYVALDESAHHLAITLRAPATTRGQTRLSIPVSVDNAHGSAHLTLSAVDQGILSLTSWTQPDVFALVYGRRAFGLDVSDTWAHLLEPTGSPGRLREGGDEGGSGGPTGLAVTSTRTVSLFSGDVALDASGHGTVTLDIPDFEGALTLMATAWSADAVGTATANTVIRDPAFVDVTLPRFLAPDDAATSLVSLVDTDAPAGRYSATVTVSGGATLLGPADLAADLSPGTRHAIPVTLSALHAGTAHVAAVLHDAAGHDLLHRSWDLLVRPAHLPVSRSTTRQQQPGESVTADPALLDGLDPSDSRLTLGYAGVHGIDTVGLLQTVEAVAWGSSDSLAAAARPLLLFRGHPVLAALSIPGGADKRIRDAVDTLVDREDAGGRIGDWNLGDGGTLPWQGIYLADFLLRAKLAGYAIPGNALDRALDWLDTEQAQNTAENTAENGGGGNSSDTAVTPNTRAYALYVLARAGRLDTPALRSLYDALGTRGGPGSPDGGRLTLFWGDPSADATNADALALGHLAGGLALADERPDSNDVFGRAVDALGPPRSGRPSLFDWRYWIYVRDLAGLVPLAAESNNHGLAQHLVDRFGDLDLPPNWLDDETATGLLEAGAAMNRDLPAGALTVDGKPQPGPLHLPATFTADPAHPAALTIANTGTVPLWLSTTATGTPKSAPAPVSQNFELHVSTLSMTGQPLDTAHLRQNDRFLVVLDGRATDDDAHHCVLIDPLPAGWEIEGVVRPADAGGIGDAAGTGDGNNSDDDSNGDGDKAASTAPYAFLGPLTAPRTAQAQDDRFLSAFDLSGDTAVDTSIANPIPSDGFRLAYIVRAVTPGRFIRPETMVTDRFRPTLFARTAAGSTVVDPR